jgi:sporulation protein YlmC with PRC-barrel domain
MLKMRRVSETYEMKVFTDNGDYFGDVEDTILSSNKVSGCRIKSTKVSILSKVIGSDRGVIVTHQMVRAVGDVLVISKNAVPTSVPGKEDDE